MKGARYFTLQLTICHRSSLKFKKKPHFQQFSHTSFSVLDVTKGIIIFPKNIIPLVSMMLHTISIKYPNFKLLQQAEHVKP